ncbi:MAG: coenzyme F420-0:L-glutamate ligase [Chloroflexi bacterium]|nr:coenzyme F420-0:L-glutamate ligase [Chloroflexota bacterium]
MWQFGQPNPGKQLQIKLPQGLFARYPIRTHLITKQDDILDVVRQYAAPYLVPGDILVIGERAVAITEGRSYPLDEIHPSRLAHFLCRFVYKSPYGIGIGSPWTMEFAIREAGWPRLFLAAAISAVTKPFGLRGIFYKIAGDKVRAIDGPTPYTIPPYNECVTLGPQDSHKTARMLSQALGGQPVLIIDANDLGVKAMGWSSGVDVRMIELAFRDNPLGQEDQQTPIAVVRRETRRVAEGVAVTG